MEEESSVGPSERLERRHSSVDSIEPSVEGPASAKIRRLATKSSLAATLKDSFGSQRVLHAAANASLRRAEKGELSFSDFLAVTHTENANGYNGFMSRVHTMILSLIHISEPTRPY